MTEDSQMAAVVKGRERYVFLWHDDRAGELLRILGRFAANPELSFTWYDAATMSQHIREAKYGQVPLCESRRRLDGLENRP